MSNVPRRPATPKGRPGRQLLLGQEGGVEVDGVVLHLSCSCGLEDEMRPPEPSRRDAERAHEGAGEGLLQFEPAVEGEIDQARARHVREPARRRHQPRPAHIGDRAHPGERREQPGEMERRQPADPGQPGQRQGLGQMGVDEAERRPDRAVGARVRGMGSPAGHAGSFAIFRAAVLTAIAPVDLPVRLRSVLPVIACRRRRDRARQRSVLPVGSQFLV